MKKLLLTLLLASPVWASHNNIYDIHTDTITVQNSVIFHDGSVLTSTASIGGLPAGMTFDGSNLSIPNAYNGDSFEGTNTGELRINDIKIYQSGTTGIRGELFGESTGEIDLDDLNTGLKNPLRIEFSSVVIDDSESFTNPDPSALLELRSSSKGFLPPRVSTSGITNPATGLITFSSTTFHWMGWNGSTWKQLDN